MALGCVALLVLLILLFVAQTMPWVLLVIPIGFAAGIITAIVKARNNKIASIDAFERQAQVVDEFANQIAKGTGLSAANFAMKPNELLLASQDNVSLLEWVSTGSTYQGGSAGFSFRVMRGVSYRVGRNSGQLVKNPPALKTVDVGTVNFTTQRITFVGQRETRAYDVDKMLSLQIDHNGQTVMIAVSNRQKPSALQGSTFDLVGPGFLVQTALTVHNSDAQTAAAQLHAIANELRASAQATRVALRLTK